MSASTKNILFLDIDGVLNSKRSCAAFGGYPHDFAAPDMRKFDHVAIALIRTLCAETKTSIVLSSDWRLSYSPEKVASALDLPIVDKTPRLPGTRGMEINSWLSAHPGVERFAIVDDIAQMFDAQANNFVQTDDEYGLSLRNYQDLKRILGGVKLNWSESDDT